MIDWKEGQDVREKRRGEENGESLEMLGSGGKESWRAKQRSRNKGRERQGGTGGRIEWRRHAQASDGQ